MKCIEPFKLSLSCALPVKVGQAAQAAEAVITCEGDKPLIKPLFDACAKHGQEAIRIR